MSVSDVGVRLSVRDRAKFTREMDHAEGDLQEFGGAASQADATAGGAFGRIAKGAAVMGAAIVAAAGASVVALAKIGTEFDTAYDTIRVGTGATGEAMAALQEDFRAVVSTVPTDFASASTAIADLNTRLGLAGEPLQALSGQFLELARITGGDVATSIESTTRVFADWGIEADAMPGTLDALFRASQATGIGMDQLAQQLVQYGAPMRQLGFEFEESAALLANFEKQGVNAELVMGSMRQALGRMAREGEPAVETFQRVTEEIANAGSVSEANAMALELFGARAGPDMAAAIREGRFEVGALVDTIAGGSETIQGAAADTWSWQQSWQLFKNNALLAIEPVAARVFGALGRGMEWLSGQMPAIQTAMQPVFDWMLAVWPQVSGAVRSFAAAAIEAWPRISEAIVTFWGYAEPVFSLLGTTLGWLWNNILTPLWNFWVTQVMPDLASSVQTYGPVIRDVITYIGDSISWLWDDVLTPAWSFWVNTAWPQIQAGAEVASAGVVGAIDGIQSALTRITEGSARFREAFLGVWQQIVDGVAVAWEFILGIVSKVEDAADRIGRGAQRAAGWLPGIGGGSVAETMAPSTRAPLAIPSASFATAGTAQVSQVTTTDMRTNPTNVHLTVHAVDADSFRRVLQTNRRELAEEVAIAVGRDKVTA